ncbi:Malonate transporter MadL subunit [Marinomonas spartinae]|uniref:Malonate transporter MadL subunit n=1 Tax=Marinomonas spartinae TaxID=1792290 RepID=A0A1A8TIR3_9GAMM|nr:malonate transporter subunit MadL [Marinomonas spartinae]SBS33271.1 Malonate transporter MadL subunit [Marinomonas spartinae]SBS34725.1 Malonate transporter MadL subunit [Marinomonas spartinae]
MIIYGVSLLAICTLVGISIGQVLGHLLGLPANVGGVGIAMILLILSGSYLNKKGVIDPKTEQGVEFWSAVYIPVVVAMAAKQNVFGAFSGGAMAISAGVTAVVLGFALVPVLDRMGKEKTQASTSISSPSTDRV